MLVSVIVPTYNRAHMIGKTIESITKQTYKDLEILIIDDGSTDNSEEVVKGYSGLSGIPVKYYQKPNGGCASARNKGVALATGECIAFLDSDDQWMPNAIESLVTTLVDSGADFVYSPVIEINEKGRKFVSNPAAAGQPELFSKEHFFTTRARVCSLLYRREIFDRAGIDEGLKYNEDSDFLQRVALQFKAAYSALPTAMVFQHGSNKSGNRLEINRALLKSSTRILKDFPVFAESLGCRAEMRLDEIRTNLIEELLAADQIVEAREIAYSVKSNLRADLRLSLHLHNAMPMKICKIVIALKDKFYGVYLFVMKKHC